MGRGAEPIWAGCLAAEAGCEPVGEGGERIEAVSGRTRQTPHPERAA